MRKRTPSSNLFVPVATLIGTVIGAGILGIPFAVAQVGFSVGVMLLISLTAINATLQLMFAEVTLRTKSDHQIPGYSDIYIGHAAKKMAFVVGMLTGYGTLLAYLIGQGEVLKAIFGGSSILWSLSFFAIGSYIVFRGLNAIKAIEVVMTLVIFAILGVIGFSALPYFEATQLAYWDMSQLAIPYGVLLFALSGTAVIPEIRLELAGQEKRFPKVILAANAIIFTIYLLFMFFVLGVTGKETTEVATIGLGNSIGPWMVVVGNVLAFFTISTSFLTIGLAMRRVYQFDYNLPRWQALTATMAVPLVIFLLGARDFITVLGIVGGILMGIQSTMIILAFWKAKMHGDRKPEFSLGIHGYVGIVLIAVFAVGAGITLLNLI